MFSICHFILCYLRPLLLFILCRPWHSCHFCCLSSINRIQIRHVQTLLFHIAHFLVDHFSPLFSLSFAVLAGLSHLPHLSFATFSYAFLSIVVLFHFGCYVTFSFITIIFFYLWYSITFLSLDIFICNFRSFYFFTLSLT